MGPCGLLLLYEIAQPIMQVPDSIGESGQEQPRYPLRGCSHMHVRLLVLLWGLWPGDDCYTFSVRGDVEMSSVQFKAFASSHDLDSVC